jgi:hypothetical protein
MHVSSEQNKDVKFKKIVTKKEKKLYYAFLD